MVLLVKISVVLVCLPIENLVEMSAGVHLRWFVCGGEALQHQVKRAQSLVKSRKMG